MTPAAPSPVPAPANTLYYGDNLDVLLRHVAAESVDLIYLDPPFNSNAGHNVLFAERDACCSAFISHELRAQELNFHTVAR